MKTVTSVAPTNIALIKYWGKRDGALNLPAVPSLSFALRDLHTTTQVTFDSSLEADDVTLNDEPVANPARISEFLDLIRHRAGMRYAARVVTQNNFPTAAGLASSASGFAALAMAGSHAAGLSLSDQEMSVLARRGSGSAARSIFGGYVRMFMGDAPDGSDAFAEEVRPPEYMPLSILVAVTTLEEKKVHSRAGMEQSRESSPYYDPWLRTADADLERALSALERKDLDALGTVTEESCLKMHAVMQTTRPSLLYWNATTLEVMHRVRGLRERGTQAYFTIDAGPHVVVFCEPSETKTVREAIEDAPGLSKLYETSVGPGARILESV